MTITRRDDQHETPFGKWLKSKPELDSREYCPSITDSDFWVHRYTPRQERGHDVRQVIDYIMNIEIKCFDRNMPFAQSDTLMLVNQLCRIPCTNKNGRRITAKLKEIRPGRVGRRLVRCFGVHLLQMSNDRPDTSHEMRWDAKYVLTEESLIRLIRFDLDPDSPSRLLDTRRHHRRPAYEIHPIFPILLSGGDA